jgi:hypothetical protein
MSTAARDQDCHEITSKMAIARHAPESFAVCADATLDRVGDVQATALPKTVIPKIPLAALATFTALTPIEP